MVRAGFGGPASPKRRGTSGRACSSAAVSLRTPSTRVSMWGRRCVPWRTKVWARPCSFGTTGDSSSWPFVTVGRAPKPGAARVTSNSARCANVQPPGRISAGCWTPVKRRPPNGGYRVWWPASTRLVTRLTGGFWIAASAPTCRGWRCIGPTSRATTGLAST